MKTYSKLLALCFFASNALFADVEIHMKSPEGSLTTFWIGEHYVKMETEGTSGFVIVDLKGQKQFMVDHLEQMVIDVSHGLSATSPSIPTTRNTPNTTQSQTNIEIIKLGNGPKIAGFKSEKYEIKANGTLCSREFLSTEPFKYPEITQLLDVMTLLDNPDIGNLELYTPCEQAELTLEQQYKTLGIPLRSLNPHGEVLSEVVHFQVSQAPEGTYDFPDNYKQTSLRELLDEQMQNMSQDQHIH